MDVRPFIEPLKDLRFPVAIASADRIRKKSFGEVKLPDLFNHKTGLPTNGGLMCAKIFGPIKDYECLCGKYSLRGQVAAVCEECGVEIVSITARSTRIGHAELATPVLHPWLAPIVRTILGWSEDKLHRVLATEEYVDFPLGGLTNGRAVHESLRYAKSDLLPDCTALMMDVIPILPPALRENADLDHLYRRVINRNNRLKRLQELSAPNEILRNEERMLQEAIEQVFDNEHARKPVTDPDRRTLRSLGAMTIDVMKSNPFDVLHLLCMGFEG